jgi:hypothetical protein
MAWCLIDYVKEQRYIYITYEINIGAVYVSENITTGTGELSRYSD